ncbi:alpha/beta hydrolase [Pseudomonas sp. gcc21]|uniref:alpha/beta fold hydrolase n=1 Tax=Pseudomonas sp. gcc21 TaxID=2726989 RepID=UPI0014526EF2|nr:alpha/beta fold hydrolase [Pseudomonas sp. gcc21]QJD59329.1 alpha/beta hydrolase [Pseudomonas sp. gcc21]
MKAHGPRTGVRCAALSLVFSLSLIGCSSGSGSDDDHHPDPDPGSEDVSEGVFLDSPVAGIRYETPSQNGTTDGAGVFRYKEGETVTFSVAGIELGSAAGQSIVTPQTVVADAEHTGDPAVLNISRFLQSLDADGDLANGIGITPEITSAMEANNTLGSMIDWADTESFEAAMTGPEGLLTALNAEAVFAENAQAGQRELRTSLEAWTHLQDSLDKQAGKPVDTSLRPVVFIHGGAGSASQFESQAQRFMANGYPRSHLAVFEYDTSNPAGIAEPAVVVERHARLNALIDELLRTTGAEQIDLMGHSLGTGVSALYLASPQHAAKVAHYVNIDGRAAEAPPGQVPTLALWGQYVTQEITGAENIYPEPDAPVGHIEVATSADSFSHMYRFFNGREPATNQIPEAEGDAVWIAGRANIFPQNIGAEGATLRVFEVDPETGVRLADTPVYEHAIDSSGTWGPIRGEKHATYEFGLIREVENADHYFYREGFSQDSYFVRLNTSQPGSGVGALLSRSAAHTNLNIGRDKELWGDQGEGNDVLTVNGTNVITAETAPLLDRLSSLFLHDRGADQQSEPGIPDPTLAAVPFITSVDLFIPAASPPYDVIAIELTPRGGDGAVQRINVPNWPSSQVRSVSVQFRDYLQ